MLGGEDIVLPGTTSTDDLDVIVRFLRSAWPNAVFEGARVEGGPPLRLDRPFPVQDWAEVFAYRDAGSYLSWKAEGLTEANADAIVYVAVERDALAFVVGSLTGEAGVHVHELMEALIENRRSHPDRLCIQGAA